MESNTAPVRRTRHSHETQPVTPIPSRVLVTRPPAYWAALDAEERQERRAAEVGQ